jgi:hypothetical protein
MLANYARLPLAEVYSAGLYDLYDPTGRKFGLQAMCLLGDQLPYAPCGWFWVPADEPIEAEETPTMMVASVGTASLPDQARRCRRLAEGLLVGDTKAMLLALAVEYESACQAVPEAMGPRTCL